MRADIDYEPADSTTAMFGGNSNWRGPVWFPLNYLMASALERYHEFFGADLAIEYPTGSGTKRDARRGRGRSLGAIGVDLQPQIEMDADHASAVSSGCKPTRGWRNNLLFFGYFHGDNGAGLGACHQTGWTGLVADVIRRRHRACPTVSEVVQRLVSRMEA